MTYTTTLTLYVSLSGLPGRTKKVMASSVRVLVGNELVAGGKAIDCAEHTAKATMPSASRGVVLVI